MSRELSVLSYLFLQDFGRRVSQACNKTRSHRNNGIPSWKTRSDIVAEGKNVIK